MKVAYKGLIFWTNCDYESIFRYMPKKIDYRELFDEQTYPRCHRFTGKRLKYLERERKALRMGSINKLLVKILDERSAKAAR